MSFSVLVTDRVSVEGLVPLTDNPLFDVSSIDDSSSEEFEERLKSAAALIVRSATRVGSEMIDRAGALKVIGRAGVGLDNIDVAAATRRGIPVFNSPDANTVAAAELTVGLMLALARRIPEADRSMHGGSWDRQDLLGMELRGRTLGLIGAGRIGGEVARRAIAFGMKVIAFDPYLSEEQASSLGIRLVALEDVITGADVISIHVPLTDETHRMVAAQEIGRMRPDALLVNASRGGVVDEAALVEALEAGRIGGAALDVFESEPLAADSPLRTAPRLILTPHLGASTGEAQLAVAMEVSSSIRDALLEGDFSGAVNADELALR